MPSIQEIIHKFEVGEGSKMLQRLAMILSLVALMAIYNVREYQGFSTVGAMESAHLARQLSEGRGFTTLSLRPLALSLEETQKGEGFMSSVQNVTEHPDMGTPPVHPFFLSLWMRLLPFNYDIPSFSSETFRRYQPEVLISFIHQGLFLLNGLLLLYLGKKLFDESVGWMSMACFFCAEWFWQFCFSGHDTMLLTTWFLLLVCSLVALERASKAEGAQENEALIDEDMEGDPEGPDASVIHPPRPRSASWFLGVACVAGLLLGLAGLTRYAFLWLLLPVILFTLLCLNTRKMLVTLTIVLTAGVVVAPWLIRNMQVSGSLFGLRSYHLYMDTSDYPEDRLERSFLSEVPAPGLDQYFRKAFEKLPSIIKEELPTLGGSFLTFFFFAGLFMPFGNPSLNRLRWFALGVVLLMVLVQALGQTYRSGLAETVHGENHLVVLAPLLFLFAVAFFQTLVDQLELPYEGLRPVVSLVFVALVSLPLWTRLLPPRPIPFAYPIYNPKVIQLLSQWNSEQESLMSDIPWAVAWYGNRPCYWLTRKVSPDFFQIHDERDAVEALYLTQRTTDLPFTSSFLQDRQQEWARLYMDVQVRSNLPKGFPLLYGHPGLVQDQLYVSDKQRWLPAFQSN